MRAADHCTRLANAGVNRLEVSDVSDTLEALGGVAEAIELHAHSIHQREVEAAELAVLVTGVGVIEHAAGLERPAERPGGEHRNLRAVMIAARPHIRHEDETGVDAAY